ncbi:hypothetical protein VE00_06999 [Pseudogymnoascus sp. WSF 3629]|nr:hypothetical protein VE00_06999 [Pseudogymnoascus sp. WSF 3629]
MHITMHITKTLILLLLPLLAITSPTPREAADDIATLDAHTSVNVNLAPLQDLQHRLSNVHTRITNIADKLAGPSNNVANQFPGAAGASFRAAVERYRADQAKAGADLVKLEKGLGEYVEAVKRRESADRKFWG